MKYYESNFDEYVKAVTNYNLHEDRTREQSSLKGNFVSRLGASAKGINGLSDSSIRNKIYYGGSGVGKYSQALYYISQFSSNGFVSRRICFQNEKFNFQYFASDVHYEIDMSLLGCNSKILWHELVQQIVDIMLVSRVPVGIVMCKNFHLIHSELLEIFYSYIQEYCNPLSNVQLRFIIITEHVSFLPNNILDVCEIVALGRPSKAAYKEMVLMGPKLRKYVKEKGEEKGLDDFLHKVSCGKMKTETCEAVCAAIDGVSMDHVLNIKEINQFAYAGVDGSDVFNVVCDTIIGQMLALCGGTVTVPLSESREPLAAVAVGPKVLNPSVLNAPSREPLVPLAENANNKGGIISVSPKGGEPLVPLTVPLTGFRDALYDILIYNLDVGECLWYIYGHFVGLAGSETESMLLIKMHDSLKYFNNNYRPIYHLERMMLDIVKEYTRILENKKNF